MIRFVYETTAETYQDPITAGTEIVMRAKIPRQALMLSPRPLNPGELVLFLRYTIDNALQKWVEIYDRPEPQRVRDCRP